MTRTLALSTLAMVCALSASPPVSAQMMKKGTTSGKYYAYGTFKASLGKSDGSRYHRSYDLALLRIG
jgi:hypothetical protein